MLQSPHAAFVGMAAKRPQAPFLVAPASAGLPYARQGFRLSYSEVGAEVERLRRAYAAAGYGRGARVGLLLENRPEFFMHWLALNALGVSLVPINPDLRPDELLFQLGMAEAELLVAIPERLAACEASIWRGPSLPGRKTSRPPVAPALSARPARRTMNARCSSRRAAPDRRKAAGSPNFYFLRLADWYVTQGGVAAMSEGAETVLTPLPMFHMNALGCSTLGMILMGGAVTPLDRFHASRWWPTVVDFRRDDRSLPRRHPRDPSAAPGQRSRARASRPLRARARGRRSPQAHL